MRSPAWPLAAIICIWTMYAGSCVLRGGGGAPAPARARVVTATRPEVAPPRRPGESDREGAALDAPKGADVLEEPAPAEAGAEETGEVRDEPGDSALTAEDRELLDLLASGSDSGVEGLISALKKFLVEHPEHRVSRGMLALFLISQEGTDPAEMRSQIAALQRLAPEMGLPDLLLAWLEARDGRPDAAAQLLAAATGKDLTWLPDFELARLAILRELEAGKPSLETLRNLFSTALPACLVLRNIATDFLTSAREDGEGSPGEAAAETGAESAPEILRLGQSLQGEGGFLIHNLVGGAIVEMSLKEIEASRELTPEEAALRDRTRSIQSLATLFSDRLEQVLLAEPDLVPVYLRDVAEHGEAVAARRTLINYLEREVSR